MGGGPYLVCFDVNKLSKRRRIRRGRTTSPGLVLGFSTITKRNTITKSPFLMVNLTEAVGGMIDSEPGFNGQSDGGNQNSLDFPFNFPTFVASTLLHH